MNEKQRDEKSLRNVWCLEKVDAGTKLFPFCHLYFYSKVSAVCCVVLYFLNGPQIRARRKG